MTARTNALCRQHDDDVTISDEDNGEAMHYALEIAMDHRQAADPGPLMARHRGSHCSACPAWACACLHREYPPWRRSVDTELVLAG